jgi:hypothetical protein
MRASRGGLSDLDLRGPQVVHLPFEESEYVSPPLPLAGEGWGEGGASEARPHFGHRDLTDPRCREDVDAATARAVSQHLNGDRYARYPPSTAKLAPVT